MDNIAKNSVLVIDDEKTNLMILSRMLAPNYTVYLTKNGTSAIEMINKCMPDLILLDVIMPDISGFDVLKMIKESPAIQNIPVIFITGLESAEDEKKGLGLGAVDFIHKPFSEEKVMSKVQAHLPIV